MKYAILYLFLFLNQGEDITIRDIGVALKSGSSKELIKFCNRTVEITIDGASSH